MVNNMKDMHSHILYGIDDGSKNLAESIEILKKLSNEGVTDIMFTPHYIEGSKYNCNNERKKSLFKDIKKEIKKQNIDINIYLGNEVMVNNNLTKLLDKEIMTLNASRYLLIELPMSEEFPDLDLVINGLKEKGIIPIIAHPERYSYVKKNYKWVNDYLEMGVLFQGNYESLFDKYGKDAKKTLKKLLKHNMIHFLGSDVHRSTTKCNLKELRKKLKKIIRDEKIVNSLINDNFTKVINNELM